MSRIGRILGEPFVHFVLLGSLLFAGYYLVGGGARPTAPGDREIVVSAGKVEHLATLFRKTWQRPPTPDELQGLVDGHVREEVAYREGRALGLDKNDTIIRRRVRQKLDFIAEDAATQRGPTDEDLSVYLEEHAEDFALSSRLWVRQIYLDDAKHDQVAAEAMRARLNNDPLIDPRSLGDPLMLDHAYSDVSLPELARSFGSQFSRQVAELEPGVWQGPVESTYGMHIVIVDRRVPGRLPALDEVRDTVRREWRHAHQQALKEQFYRELLDRYHVIIDWPDTSADADR